MSCTHSTAICCVQSHTQSADCTTGPSTGPHLLQIDPNEMLFEEMVEADVPKKKKEVP